MKRTALIALFACLPLTLRAETPLQVGVFGAVEGVDPLIVAGHEISVPEGTPRFSPLGPGQALVVGDTLAIRAVLEDGGLRAQRLLEVYAAAGPVSAVDGQEARVMGTQVHIPPGEALRVGDWIAFSGHWSGEKVITTALKRADRDGLAQLTGVFAEAPVDGFPRLGGSAIAGMDVPQGDFEDDVWMLTGTPSGEGLRVQFMAQGLFGGVVDLEIWEGYASGPVASETWMIFGTAIYGYDREAQMPAAGTLVRVCARQGRVVRALPATAAPDLVAGFAALGCADQTATVSGG